MLLGQSIAIPRHLPRTPAQHQTTDTRSAPRHAPNLGDLSAAYDQPLAAQLRRVVDHDQSHSDHQDGAEISPERAGKLSPNNPSLSPTSLTSLPAAIAHSCAVDAEVIKSWVVAPAILSTQHPLVARYFFIQH